MIGKDFETNSQPRLIQLLLLLFAVVVNGAVVAVSAYFFYKYRVKPALGIETYADKLEKEYVWIADWMTVPSEKIAAIDRVVQIDRRVIREDEDYVKVKKKILDELLFFLDSPGADPRLRDRSASAMVSLLRKGEYSSYFYPLVEPLLYLPVAPSNFWSSQIRQKIILAMYKLDPCNCDLYDILNSLQGEDVNPAEKMVINGLLASIQLNCKKPVDDPSGLMSMNLWASISSPYFIARGGIPEEIKKKLKILEDSRAPYRERGKAAQELGKVKRYRLYVLKRMLRVLEKLLPDKRETNTHLSYIRINILFSLPKLKLCYKPMIKVMNKIWENKYVANLERNIATAIIAKYNLHCTGKVTNPGKLKK